MIDGLNREQWGKAVRIITLRYMIAGEQESKFYINIFYVLGKITGQSIIYHPSYCVVSQMVIMC